MRYTRGTQMDKPKLPVTTEVYNIIKEQIVALQLMPGQLLMVQQLSKDNGISRTPVREALIRLKDEGLVAETTGNKFRVSEITWKFIEDLYSARIAVEKVSIAFAAQNATKTQIKMLEKNQSQMEKCVEKSDYSGYFEADMQFHNDLLKILDNNIITNWMERLTDQQQRVRYLTMGISSRIHNSLEEHRRMLDAIKAGDADAALEEMEKHLMRAKNDMLSLKTGGGMTPGLFIKD